VFILRGSVEYVAVQFPLWNGQALFQGRRGQDLYTQDSFVYADLCLERMVPVSGTLL
jgi:hypothetical protein